jgi:hypothetical protein
MNKMATVLREVSRNTAENVGSSPILKEGASVSSQVAPQNPTNALLQQTQPASLVST